MDNIVEEFEVPEEFRPLLLEIVQDLSLHLKLEGMVSTMDLLNDLEKELG